MATKMTASETQKLNIGALKIMMARLEKAIEDHESIEDLHYGHCGDTKDLCHEMATLVRKAEGGDVGDDYGLDILRGLGVVK